MPPPSRRIPEARVPTREPHGDVRNGRQGSGTVFTGIIEELGRVVAIEEKGDSAVLRIAGPIVTSDAAHGASIAVNGVCLTVLEPGTRPPSAASSPPT